MKPIAKTISFVLILTIIILITASYLKSLTRFKDLSVRHNKTLKELSSIYFENDYLSNLLWINLNSNKPLSLRNTIAFEMIDKHRNNPLSLDSILFNGRNKLVIRYTEIGCNSCIDSTFSILNRQKHIFENFEILILVDFTNYEYYVKWKKIAEVDYAILWVDKNSLPFDVEKTDMSYLFTTNSKGIASSFFIPKSNFSNFLEMYLERISG